MEEQPLSYSVRVYVYNPRSFTVNVIEERGPYRGHWKNRRATILRGTYASEYEAEGALQEAVSEILRRSIVAEQQERRA